MLKANIQNIYIRNYRSIERAAIANCGQLNIFIGRNNAGKSNLLSTVTAILSHLRQATIATAWRSPRPVDQFFAKDTSHHVLLGVEFELPKEVNEELRAKVKADAPQLDKAIEEFSTTETISFVLRGEYNSGSPFLYVQQIGVGTLTATDHALNVNGPSLLHIDLPVARELYTLNQALETRRQDAQGIASLLQRGIPPYALQDKTTPIRYLLRDRADSEVTKETEVRLQQARAAAQTVDQFSSAITQTLNDIREDINRLDASPVSPMKIFSGETKTPPAYVKWLMERYGSIQTLHLTENKTPLGRPEAEQLLSLKVKRGGTERLAMVQETVGNLLGVKLDAFQSDAGRQAEMDVDEFLAEANGAGVREALRLILDLELKTPSLVLLEEPEVHLHPGLEYAVHSYLQEKSRDAQFFVTTHSTNFVDFVAFQNVYLVARNERKATQCERVDAGEAPLRISEELGLRLSTVFMFDRLVFVEGPSDELVLREFARNLNIDLVQANVGFVHMRGIRNFAHYAAHHTLDVLTKRQVRMWFIADHDELNDQEVKAMTDKLGAAAHMRVLKKRELENYLLEPQAISRLIAGKLATTKDKAKAHSVNINSTDIQQAAASLKEAVVTLRLNKSILAPVYPNKAATGQANSKKLELSIEELKTRVTNLPTVEKEIRAQIDKQWPGEATNIAPGALILDEVFKKHGVRFKKDDGDSARLARIVTHDIADEIIDILDEIVSLEP